MSLVLTKLVTSLVVTGIVTLSSYGAYWHFTQDAFDWNFLSEENNFSVNYSNKDLIGNLYGHFLIGAYGKDNRNKVWWDFAYKQWLSDVKDSSKQTKLSNEFRDIEKITSSFKEKDETGNESLNKVCETIYKKNKSSIEGTEENNVRLKIDTWRYCSNLGEEVKKNVVNRINRKKVFGF